MRRLHVALLAGLRLCAARQPGFSIHHDLLAHPQFEVVFSEAYISEPDADALIESASEATHQTYEAQFNDKDVASHVHAAPAGDQASSEDSKLAETYEVMTMNARKYLCSIPIIETPAPPNKTATELAKAEEARELTRASTQGWELINALEGKCLYYGSGWWSYSFCYGHDVTQFHAMPSSKGGPPVKDPLSHEYVLGKVQDSTPSSPTPRRSTNRGAKAVPPTADADKKKSPPNTELQIKGDQRYLVQKLEAGTLCDLTNRPRTIEIQYHCSPGSTQDRIGWIKEVTTCSYLMMVNTPRLCTDAAFLPPRETRANIISCRTIVPESEQVSWLAQKTLQARAAMVGQARKDARQPVTIGGVVVGGRHLLGNGEDGKAPAKLEPPRQFANGNDGTVVEIVAVGNSKADGGKSKTLTAEQLANLELNPEIIEEMKKKVQELAGDKGWKLEVVETPDQDERHIRGVVDGEDGDEDGQGEEKGSEEQFFQQQL